MAALSIVKVEDERGYVDFLRTADRVYRHDPHWCKPPAAKVLNELLRKDLHQQLFLAKMGDTVRARVAAVVSAELSDQAGRPYGLLGHFESQNEQESAVPMLSQAVAWLHEQGCKRVIGPMNGDTWHRYRLDVGPWDERPFLMEPYNPAWYPALWEAAGFEVLEGYHSIRLTDIQQARERFAPLHRRLTGKGYRMRRFELARFDEELDLLYALSTAIFADNFLYSPISREAFGELYEGARSLIDPELVWFALAPDGQPVGFVFGIVDYAAAVTSMGGRSSGWAKLKFALLKGRARAVNVKTLGVIPDYRRTGVVAMLMWQIYDRVLAAGFSRTNLCLIRDGNDSSRMDAGLGDVMRRYQLYQFGG